MYQPKEIKRLDNHFWLPDPLKLYTTGISVGGLILLIGAIGQALPAFPDLSYFLALVILVELSNSTSLQPQVLFSMSSAVTFATLLLLGLFPAVLVAIVGGLVITIGSGITSQRQGQASFWQRATFNMANAGLSIAIAGGVYLLTGGYIGDVMRLTNITPVILATITAECVNAGLVIGAVSLQTKRPFWEIWEQNISWGTPINIVTMVIGGGGIAIGYQAIGALGLVVFFLPIMLTIYVFQSYVRQTKAQLVQLEEIIDDRTRELQQKNEKLENRDQAKTNFYSMMNHEMRTPLTAIIGYTQLLGHRNAISGPDERMLQMIEESGHRLLGLVNDILDIARIEEGKLQILPRPMPLRPTIDQAVETLKPLADEKCLTVEVFASPSLPEVHGDPKRVSQILLNLLSNAVKYTPDTGKITVSARQSSTPDMLEVCVADTGIGIPAEDLPHIFNRFSRVERDAIRHTVGTGLGLSITEGLVKAHGGDIWVESVGGEGTCFTFTLPLAEQPQPEALIAILPRPVQTILPTEVAPIGHNHPANGEAIAPRS